MHTTTSVSSVYVHTHINIYMHESYATHVVGITTCFKSQTGEAFSGTTGASPVYRAPPM